MSINRRIVDALGQEIAKNSALSVCPEEHHTDMSKEINSSTTGIIEVGDQVFIAAPGAGLKISIHEVHMNTESNTGVLRLSFVTSGLVVAAMYVANVGTSFVSGRRHAEGGDNEALTLTGVGLGNAKGQYVTVQYVIESV